ncbi:hypothetical protein BO78DRAFT_396908 [Aspergillus sclerotiicarbonarius CBS 121057]|uniref:Secreted protein n=1 Tax=Aspergillus sclerotiicarbonarius (strain CBS 121057 / IBT 28362) TaxID=1448318 RepID=A0A319EJB9_ASPSB|nr:hypothetical protein BO78DRAFT_396908 [Aspergillus sclerotiicarbonarius CBS 121057]
MAFILCLLLSFRFLVIGCVACATDIGTTKLKLYGWKGLSSRSIRYEDRQYRDISVALMTEQLKYVLGSQSR